MSKVYNSVTELIGRTPLLRANNFIKVNGLEADILFACGPKPMLKGIKAAAQEKNIRAQLSLEERMACGIGACLACVCKTTKKDEHSQVNNTRICKEGPVFYAEDIEL